jgi:broad specificity polyphosphatase/5'/3'-nucleotidase SurE
MARQGRGYWLDDPSKRIHPEGNPYFWLGGKWAHHDEHDESDVSLLNLGFATVVPIHIDELTDEELFEERKHQFNDAMKTS